MNGPIVFKFGTVAGEVQVGERPGPPTAAFDYIYTGEQKLQFTAVEFVDHLAAVYTWDFGDGNVAVGKVVTHQYAAGLFHTMENPYVGLTNGFRWRIGKTYLVTLTVTDIWGTDSIANEVNDRDLAINGRGGQLTQVKHDLNKDLPWPPGFVDDPFYHRNNTNLYLNSNIVFGFGGPLPTPPNPAYLPNATVIGGWVAVASVTDFGNVTVDNIPFNVQ